MEPLSKRRSFDGIGRPDGATALSVKTPLSVLEALSPWRYAKAQPTAAVTGLPNVDPTGRVEAMEKRLDATLGAMKTVQPPLAKFYNSLSDEQKARFNSLRSASRPAG